MSFQEKGIDKWVKHWPFPTFEDSPDKNGTSSEQQYKAKTKYVVSVLDTSSEDEKIAPLDDNRNMFASPGRLQSREGSSDSTGRSNQSLQRSGMVVIHRNKPCGRVTPHSMSSDWNLTERSTNFVDSIRREASRAGTVAEGDGEDRGHLTSHITRPTHSTITPLHNHTNSMKSIRSMYSSSHTDDDSPSRITVEELTALMQLCHSGLESGLCDVQGSSSKKGCTVDTTHMFIKWITQRHGTRHLVVPPSLYLHLGNISPVLEKYEDISSNQVLINSPRSAVVLLRHGLSVSDLIPHPTAAKAMRRQRELAHRTKKYRMSNMVSQKRNFTEDHNNDDDLQCLSLLGVPKDIIALERLRRQRLLTVINEYADVCTTLTLPDVCNFCIQYDVNHPSSALRVNVSEGFAPTVRSSRLFSTVSRRGNQQPLKLSDSLPEEAANAKFTRIYYKHLAIKATVEHCRQLAVDTAQERKDAAMRRQQNEDMLAARLTESREAKRKECVDTLALRKAIRKAKSTAKDRATLFHRLTLREFVLRRNDAVDNIEATRKAFADRYVAESIHAHCKPNKSSRGPTKQMRIC